MIADDVSDADAAYRPLFSDTTAVVGGRHWYRVIAKNAGGNSPPSGAFGPVKIEELCLADEMKDFSLVADKSDGWKQHNVFNNCFGEYLYRLEGNQGDQLRYRVPRPVRKIRVWTWLPSGDNPLTITAGVPNGRSRPVDSSGRKRTFTPYQRKGISAAEVYYESQDFDDEHHEVTLRLTRHAWIDRVEIYFAGADDPAEN